MLRSFRPRCYLKQQQFHRCISNETANENDNVDQGDVFGTLSHSGSNSLAVHSAEKLIKDDPDGYDREEFDLTPRKNDFYYKYEVRKYARQGAVGLKRALELLQEMKSKAKLQPTLEQFAPLIYGCAKAGFTKKAFELYEESIKYDVKTTKATVTCLINACAESPFPEYGLKRLEWLMTHLKVNHTNIPLNLIHYNSAIKAYGKLGRLDEAAKLIQTMVDNGIYPDNKTFSMLLMGCASEKQAGCTIALRIFKRMKMYDLKPDTPIYEMLLRCIRDCGMGSPELVQQTFKELPATATIDQRISYKAKKADRNSKRHAKDNLVWAPLLEDLGKSIEEAVKVSDESKQLVDKSNNMNNESKKKPDVGLIPITSDRDSLASSLMPVNSDNVGLPNLLNDDHLNLLSRIRGIQFDKLNDRYSRIFLFGGIEGYLETMLRDGCRPDVKTFTLLLDLVEPSRENYLRYFELSNTFKIKRDILFYDILIQNVSRNRRKIERYFDLALHFIEEMNHDYLRPTIQIYEAIAPGCYKWATASRLLGDLQKSGFTVSDRLIRELFYAALNGGNLDSLNHLIDLSKRRKFRPSKFLVDKLENFRLDYQRLLFEHEKGIKSETKKQVTEADAQLYDHFKFSLGSWLSRVEIQEDEHPWSQFDVETKSKKDGYLGFVRHFNAMDTVKREALKRGGSLGNISYKGEKLASAARGRSVVSVQQVPSKQEGKQARELAVN